MFSQSNCMVAIPKLFATWRAHRKLLHFVSDMSRQGDVTFGTMCFYYYWLGCGHDYKICCDIVYHPYYDHVCVCVHVCTMHWGRRKKPCCGQAFLVDILEGEGFLEKRRKLLRHRAGLTDADRKKVGFPDSLGKFGSTNVLLEVGHMGCPLHEPIVIHGKLDLVAPPHKFTKSFSLWECVCVFFVSGMARCCFTSLNSCFCFCLISWVSMCLILVPTFQHAKTYTSSPLKLQHTSLQIQVTQIKPCEWPLLSWWS